ncbi:hypothetical protein OROMI_011122 [Orobanche minor]
MSTEHNSEIPIVAPTPCDPVQLNEAEEKEKPVQPSSPCDQAQNECLHAIGYQLVFLQDAVDALYNVGKEIDWLDGSAIEELARLKREISKVNEALRIVPTVLKQVLAKLQQQQKVILKEEQAKICISEAKTRENVSAAISRLANPSKRYKVSGSRLEFHDPNIPCKNSIHKAKAISLPAVRQPSVEEIKNWRKNELMRYFAVLIKVSAMFNKCKTLKEAGDEFDKLVDQGMLPLQLQMKSKHKKGERITHPEDWILAFDKSYEGQALYLNRGKDFLQNWWKGTDNDLGMPWKHDQYRK